MTCVLPVLREVAALRRNVAVWRKACERIALVPTMGALHEGHLSLVRQGKELADRVVATIFVNPTQFGPNEDLAKYPRQEEKDIALLTSVGCDLLFAPTVAEMYPEGFSTTVTVAGVSSGLCGAVRPVHFAGVATVVTKLLLQAQPDLAIFGEKDYQQLQVIKRLTRDLDIPVEILGGATVREADGLALSSRNAYLKPEERKIAPALHQAMQKAARAVLAGEPTATASEQAVKEVLAAGFASVDYMEFRDAETLAPAERQGQRPLRLIAAARLGATRLIDNIAVGG
jgi:pantoate--beta-alanine ligase